MRTASRRAGRLLAFLLLALSAAWVLLRRRSGAPAALAAVPAAPPYRRPTGDRVAVAPAGPAAAVADGRPGSAAGEVPRDALATDAGLTPEPVSAPAPAPAATDAAGEVPGDVLATDAGLTTEPVSAPAPASTDAAGEVPGDVLATDAGLTTEAPTAAPSAAEEQAFSEAPTAEIPVPAPAAPAGADDLRAIRGIGPSIERILHGLDITTYRQIAELDGADLERVRDALRDFRGRLEREDWIGQARQLHRQKYGEA